MKLINIILPLNIKILSKKERICCFLFYTFVPIIPLVLLYLKYADKNILLTALSIFIFMVCIASPIFIYEKWDEKYGIYSTIRFGSTYQFMAKYLPLFTPGLILISLSLAYILNNITLGIFISLSFIIPSLIFFRTEVFNDDNCLIDNEIVFGYPTGIYSIISLILGFYGFYNSYLLLNNISNSIMLIIITIIFQLILLFPNLVNKYLPADMRIRKNFILFILILIMIFLILVYTLQSKLIFNINSMGLSVNE